ncbi:PREDICTED: neprilysin-like [Atta cephalotes]|uniref:Peptidase M13 C-terminal domain-containing protein n=1 Tax=Atta cephalotes TaxID=12957 RepID=A0A158NP93_ATTCE|nr:PREDICTED: neprilysin-like [Atta cephalotes]
MRRFILLAFIGIFLMKNVTSSKNQGYPSRLAWLFSLNNTQHEAKERNETNNENKSIVCQSQECKKIAQIITESMDKSVDPCDDFYKYACGKWSEHNPAPKGMKSWNMFASAQVNVIKQIKEIFDEGPKKDDLLAIKLAKQWYSVCMDTDAMDSRGLEPLVFTLSRIGGWPMIMEPDEWNEEEYSWQKVDDQYVRLIGKNVFHDVRVNENCTLNECQKTVHVSIPHLPPASSKLWNVDNEKEVDGSDEDTSDEEKQSNEQNDSQEPGSEDQDDNKNDSTNNNGNEDDNNGDDEENDDDDEENDDEENDDEDNDDEENDDEDNNDNNDNKNDDEKDDNNDTNKQDNNNNNGTHDDDEENKEKRINVNKASKFAKNKKLEHSRKIKSINSKKHKNHNMKKDRIKRQVILNVHKKLHKKIKRTRKIEKNHVKQTHKERVKKTLKASQISTEETIDDKYDMMKLYANYISKVARALAEARGIEVSEEHLYKDIQDMIKFHIKLIKITAGGRKEKELTLNDFQEWYERKTPKTSNSAIDWLYKIGELFDEAHVSVNGDINIKIINPDYFSNLISLLDDTSSRTIVNYIHWNFLSNIISTTTLEMRKLYDAWEEKQKNDDNQILGISARFFKCTSKVEMSDMLAYEYVRKHFSDEITIAASDMLDDIQKEVEYQIKDSDWVDEDTKDFVLAKLVHMEKFIGYPNWYRNNTIVKRYFQGLIIGNSYYENILSYKRYSKWKELRKLLKEDEDDEIMRMDPTMVNAFFSPDLNSVALTAADFQSPLFAFGRPQAINYGIVGTIMGHEVNHGFDDSGHLYNKEGEIVEWLSAMAEAYGKRAECFVEQFNNYGINEISEAIKDYGNQTAGENIADTMGLEVAFKAYQRRERECGKPNTVLLGQENLTNDQLFFLSFANLWCEDPAMSAIKVKTRDVHSIGRLRVIGTVSNSHDFAQAYNCPIGSAMNPEKKCHIWK